MFAEMELHIATRHASFLLEAQRSGAVITPASFLRAALWVAALLDISREDAVAVLFREPHLVAATPESLASAIVALRQSYEGDLAARIFLSPALLLEAATIVQETRTTGRRRRDPR